MGKVNFIVRSLVISFLLVSFMGISSVSAAESDLEDQEQQDAANDALDEVIEKVNNQIEQGENDIYESKYVPEIDDSVEVEFSTEEDSSQSNSVKATKAAKPSGIKKYSGKVHGGSFTHTLLGDFTYGGGKVKSASKEVRASGLAFSHTRPSKISKLDSSVWQVSSTSKHKWLGVVGGVTGSGYTSYITVNLYGSGNAKLDRATYNTGV